MRLIDLLAYLSFCTAAFGLFWCFLVVHKIGPLTMLERGGMLLVAWARSQRWAVTLRRYEYEGLRETKEPSLNELMRIVGR